MKSFLLERRSINILVFGLIGLFILATPITLFFAGMASGEPHSSGFLYCFLYLMLIYIFASGLGLLMIKIIDCFLSRKLSWNTFNFLSILIGTIIQTIYFNIFIDNLFQIKLGNYDVVAQEILVFIVLWTIIIMIGSSLVDAYNKRKNKIKR